MALTRQLVILLVSGGRFDEALAVSAGFDTSKDPALAYWKSVALEGTGEHASAKELLTTLNQSGVVIPGIPKDRITLSYARSLRGSGDPEGALRVLAEIPESLALADEVQLERGADLLALGRTEECLQLIETAPMTGEEGKALAAYLKALAAWRAGKYPEAKKLFSNVPPTTHWISSASALGTALCLSASSKNAQAVASLEKSLDGVDNVPLLAESFLLLDRLQDSSPMPESAMLAKWAGDTAKPVRAKYAAFSLAKRKLSSGDRKGGESRLESFIAAYPDDPLADQARLLLATSQLQGGPKEKERAATTAADLPSAPARIRAKLAYVRGLAEASAGKNEEAGRDFQAASALDPSLASDSLFNNAVLVASTGRGSLNASAAAKEIAGKQAGAPSDEMRFQMALDLVRKGDPSAVELLGKVADASADPAMKSRARLVAAELNMKSGRGDAADRDLAKAVRENSGEPEREEYLAVFLKDTGRKADSASVIAAARAFIAAHPDSRFVPEVRLKLAESLLTSGDVQGARIEFEQLAATDPGTDLGRRALFLAAQSAARSMDPASIDDSLMLLERVASSGGKDQLIWQARLQQGAIKNSQNLPLEALAIYDKILSTTGDSGPDTELRAAAMMARGDTLHELAAKDPAKDREAVTAWKTLAADPSVSIRWRNQALCKSAIVLEKLGEGDAALAAYYEAFKNPRATEPEQLWHDKAAFEAARFLESRKQWADAVTLYGQIAAEGGPRADEAKARLSKLKLENFLWEN